MNPGPRLLHVTVRTPARDVPFLLPDTPPARKIFDDIVAGRTYPLVSFLQDVRTVVDVGANVGAAALYFALSYPEAQVFAFEPCPDTYRLLERNLAAAPRARAFAFGLFDRDCTAPLHLGRFDSVTNSVRDSSLNTGASVAVPLRDARTVLAGLRLTAIDILKVDTEGCEVPILEALADLLPATRVLYLEYHAEEDRLALDALLRGTHILYAGRVLHPHRGELCYVACTAFPSPDVLNGLRVHGGPARRPGG